MNQNVQAVSAERNVHLSCVVMTQWSDEVHQRIAKAIKNARGQKSAQWLADRTAELGHPITRSQIANYESGRKRALDIADLIVLAAALSTSPVVLVYPGPYDAEVEVLPGRYETALSAADWFAGIEVLDSVDHLIIEGIDGDKPPFMWLDWFATMQRLHLSRELGELEQQRKDFLSDHDPLTDADANKLLKNFDSHLRLLKKQIRALDA